MADGEVRVRFAPSPTGHLHVGGARTALFNWLFARNKGGKFILRIEDTDLERSTEESYRAIIDALKWLRLDWDEGPLVGGGYGPYFQSERRHLYRERAHRLLSDGLAYYCFCSPEMLAQMRDDLRKQGKDPKYDGRCKMLLPDNVGHRLAEGQPHVIRFKMPLEGATVVHDIIRGEVTFHNPQLDDFVLIKSDGYPTYNFAVTVDDALMKITHVIRGEDHLSNTPKQIRLYEALGVRAPRYAHVPLILGPDKTRLSKRHGATAVGQFKEDGYLPEAMVNYLALLGWAYDDKTEIFAQDDLTAKFSLERVSSTAAVFDYPKLQWMNAEYMKYRSLEDKIDLIMPHLEKAGLVKPPVDDAARRFIGQVVEVVGERLKVANQIAGHVRFFFKDEIDYDAEAAEKFLKRHYIAAAFKILEERLSRLEQFDGSTIEPLMKGLVSEMGLKTRDLFQPVRVALTGSRHSPGLYDVMTVLGRDKVLHRLQRARKTFS
jgi:nondiscriminating glutamyl-tRNA synthetase